MPEPLIDFIRQAIAKKPQVDRRIKNPLVAQEEANTILGIDKKTLGDPTLREKLYTVDKDALKKLKKRTKDFVLTAQAEKTVEAENLGLKDKMTDTLSRYGIELAIREAIAEVDRNGGAVHVIFMDLRGFKKFNDEHGHAIGDRALRMLADSIKKHIRHEDVIGRWGGEEFILLIKNGEIQLADIFTERLHHTLEGLPAPYNRIYADMGMATYAQGDKGKLSMESLIDRADKAMYVAKANELKTVKQWQPHMN